MLSSKAGLKLRVRTAIDVNAEGGGVTGGVRLCKDYVDKVYIFLSFCISFVILFSSPWLVGLCKLLLFLAIS